MRTTIDSAGRIVIPKSIRRAIGLTPGEVEVIPDGAGVRIEPVSGDGVSEERGRLVIDAEVALDDETVRFLRLSDQQ